MIGIGNLDDVVVSTLYPVKRLKFWDCLGRTCPAPGPSHPLTFVFSIPAAPLKNQSWWTLRENEEVADGAGAGQVRVRV